MGAIDIALQACRARISSACLEAGRGNQCARLLAVSKSFPASAVREAHLSGQACFGESYLQEALAKMRELADLDLEWHFIGPLQSNKTRPVAERFSWVHSIERDKIAGRLSEQRPARLPSLNVCIQVNVSGEASKRGVAPEDAADLALLVSRLPRLKLRGFMAIPEPTQALSRQRAQFRMLAELLADSKRRGLELDTLSMGMSADLEMAILEGATLVRVGTAIFGARHYNEVDSA
jgi:pyridoxal phosphate enzyme (YggS family)